MTYFYVFPYISEMYKNYNIAYNFEKHCLENNFKVSGLQILYTLSESLKQSTRRV